jgi:hypothetical protein
MSPEYTENEKMYDMELIIQGLFAIYPDAKYVAFNAAISNTNQAHWKDHWYISVMRHEPTLEVINGYYTWVSRNKENDEINNASAASEDAIAYIHFSSKGYYFKDMILQTSPNEFISPDNLCWMRNENNEIVHFTTERIETTVPNELDEIFSEVLTNNGLKNKI